MNSPLVIDTFPEFMALWDNIGNLSIEEQLYSWENFYSSDYPEIYRKITDTCKEDGIDCRQIMSERILPFLNHEFKNIIDLHRNLEEAISILISEFSRNGILDFPAVFVIYIGPGLGAGWATEYRGDPSIFLGLENIHEMGWGSSKALKGLIAHEAGHLYHQHERKNQDCREGKGPLWDLYEEGFAQHYEYLALGESYYHQSLGQSGWEKWCSDNISTLAGEFLEQCRSGGDTRKFFGSWYDVHGWKETGYFLGAFVIRKLNMPIGAIATLTTDEVDKGFNSLLKEISEQ